MRRIGLLGGTFNPPHVGHLIMAEEARLKGKLDEIWWLPNRIPPHKKLSSDTSEEQRMELVSKMVQLHPAYKLSKMEMDRTGPSYTVDTVGELLNKEQNCHFSFIMGGDSLINFHKWYKADKLQKMISFIVLVRPGFAVPTNIEEFKEILLLDEVSLELSSSYIRDKIKNHSMNKFLLTNEVFSYIKENRLYE
ncbi:nicotinate-nucleotide adenylyltransferase [Salipaludibacillus daqingensis]|uniref:nicotinate-nucleotide adenylyltransferase n=1 Tax=Salipaludibacillus daqingensis TaxID=3041001 RepID=UPI0024768003|nr:nicotinate-nucleotide adenylyltransferase [Salipaludibacillus daqingensis]